ncbi:MAG: zinc metallopeptidase [Lachnospiraceae bacterium]|nr:zinc metallopeptidase [Lachnospiraceae bacterium]MBR1817142.1 zinc metallopeptidase [Lachnospiraceae bacterium]
MYYGMDFTYILVIIGAVISMIASWNVNARFKKYSTVRNSRGLTSQQAAETILHGAGIYDVRIERISGNLTDHYSPSEKVLRLSDSVYNQTSVAAIGVAAHECGHAIQHQVGYGPLKLRSLSVPIANIGSKLSWPIIIAGLIMGSTGLAQVGVWLFVAVVFFQLITLPVEIDASHRAIKILDKSNMLAGEELAGSKKVLMAAALTYVAALFSTILQLLRLIMIVNSSRRD